MRDGNDLALDAVKALSYNRSMRKEPLFLIWHIQGASATGAERIKQALDTTGNLDYVEEDHRQGGGAHEVIRHRLGDYFSQICLLEDSKDYSGCLRLLFQRSPGAGRYWKDLMVHLLERIKTAGGDVIMNLAFQGDEFPQEAKV